MKGDQVALKQVIQRLRYITRMLTYAYNGVDGKMSEEDCESRAP